MHPGRGGPFIPIEQHDWMGKTEAEISGKGSKALASERCEATAALLYWLSADHTASVDAADYDIDRRSPNRFGLVPRSAKTIFISGQSKFSGVDLGLVARQ